MGRIKSASKTKKPATESPWEVAKTWHWLLPESTIWCGWRHLVEAVADLEDPNIALQPMHHRDRTVELGKHLEIIWYSQPKLLLVDTRGHTASKAEIMGLLDALEVSTFPNRSFALKRRFLEVLDAGNHVGRFSVPIPYVPAPMPPEPESPFNHVDFERKILILDPLLDAFDAAVGKKLDLDPAETWGRILLSSMLYGSLTSTAALLALPDALKHPESDPELRWLMVTPVKRTDDEVGVPPRRWFPDPLTRLLLARARRSGVPVMPVLSRVNARQVMRLFIAYARRAGFESMLPRGLRDLARAVVTNLHEYIPSWLVAYSANLHPSTSLPGWVWQRLLKSPDRLATELTPRPRLGGGDRALGVDDEDDNDEDENEAEDGITEEQVECPELSAQLRRFGSVVRKGKKPLRQRLIDWHAKQGETLLPNVDLVVRWCTDWLLVAGRGRPAIRSPKYLYENINATGSRIVGQLGGMDLRQFKDPNAFIEVYQTALEDGPSMQVKRKIVRGIRSFHDYLVARHDAPVLDDDLFRLSGGRGGAVDANLITLDLFNRAKTFLVQMSSLSDETVSESLVLLADLGYFCGLRRSEGIGLRVGDLLGRVEVWLKVKPNELRTLKTTNGRRDLPLFLLMPSPILERFMAWVRRRWDEEKRFDAPLFPAFVVDGRVNDKDPRLHRIVDALRRAADDETLRYHHLRHSFTNWLIVRFWIAEQGENQALHAWLPDTPHFQWLRDTAQAVYRGHFGVTPTSRRSVMQVSRHLGHSGFDITLYSYFHLADLLLAMAVRRMSPNIGLDALSALSGLSISFLESRQLHFRKIRSDRNDGDALLLDDIASRVLRPRDRRPKDGSRENQTLGLPAICFQVPEEPFARLLHLADAVNQVQRSGESPNDVALRFGIAESDLNTQIERLSRLPPGFLLFQPERDVILSDRRMAGVDLPRGESQIVLARNVVETWERLLESGDPPKLKKLAVANRLARLAERASHWWLPGTEITMAFDNLPEAKLWCWWVRKLQLGHGLFGAHLPNMDRTKTTVTANQQRKYWEKGLSMSSLAGTYGGGEPGKESARGAVVISVDLGLVPADACAFTRPDALYGMRFALGMLGNPKSDGVLSSDEAPVS